MDLGTATVTLLVGAAAVLPRVPALSSAGRAQAAIQRDTELWAALAPGGVRDRLGAEIDTRTAALLDERARDKGVEQMWSRATACAAVAWVLFVVALSIKGEEQWVRPVGQLLLSFGWSAGVIAVLLFGVTIALTTVRAVSRMRGWFGRRRPAGADTYEI